MSRPRLGDAKLIRVSVPLHRATIAAYAARAEAEGRPARAIMRAELERGCAPPIPICTTWITRVRRGRAGPLRGDARAGDGEVREAPGAERMSRTDNFDISDHNGAWGGWWRLNKRREPVPCRSFAEVELQDMDIRRVAHDEGPGWSVSTMFIGLDHALAGPPVLWETLVVGKGGKDTCRYSTRAEALKGHRAAVARIRIRRRRKG